MPVLRRFSPTVAQFLSIPHWSPGHMRPLGSCLQYCVSQKRLPHNNLTCVCSHPPHCRCNECFTILVLQNLSCSKPQDARAADDQHNNIAKHWNEATNDSRTLAGYQLPYQMSTRQSQNPQKWSNEKRVLPQTKQLHSNTSFSGKASTRLLISP